MNELQVKILEVKPAIVKFNYEEMKNVAAEIKAEYEGLIFTDETVKEGKKTVAELNKIQKSINDFKVKTKKDLTQSVSEFEEQCKDIISDFDDPINFISEQLETFEIERVRVKTLQIKSIISQLYENLKIEQKYQIIEFRSDWLNSTKKEKDLLANCSYDAKECLNKQQRYYQNVELIKTLVELSGAKYDLGVKMDAEQFISMIEYKSMDQIKESITNAAERQFEQQKALVERLEREAHEKAQKEIDKANELANKKVEELVIANEQQINEMVEFVAFQVKIEEPVKIYDKTELKKMFRFEVELYKSQFENLKTWFEKNEIKEKVI